MTKKLQEDGISLSDFRLLFDTVADRFPATNEHLLPAARIVHAPAFESALVKVSSSSFLAMS